MSMTLRKLHCNGCSSQESCLLKKQQELTEVVQALDSIRQLHQLEHLQQAVCSAVLSIALQYFTIPSAPIRVFSVESV